VKVIERSKDMALIGEMQYLKIGGNTYSIPSSTETDPVFSASAAAGITVTDISNWNAKVSDDKTWNGVALDVTLVDMSNNSCRIPFMWDISGETSARMIRATKIPANNEIALYDDNAYLKSTTPSANDNSTNVATTAYVDAAIISYTAGTGIYITNGVISVNLDSAEGGTY
jgi:hypothetical protein